MPELSQDDLIRNMYMYMYIYIYIYDSDEGYGSAQALYNQATHTNLSITLDFVKTWINKQPNKQRTGYTGYNMYKAPFPRFEYQIYSMDMSYLQQTNQPRYALTVIDIFSKCGDVQPMHDTYSSSVYDALQTSFNIMKCPMSIYTDDDSAFKSRVKKVIDGEGIKHLITLTHANVVERFIRSINTEYMK